MINVFTLLKMRDILFFSGVMSNTVLVEWDNSRSFLNHKNNPAFQKKRGKKKINEKMSTNAKKRSRNANFTAADFLVLLSSTKRLL